ncbi:MAG: hypothetical protein NC418_02610 [Muribaculaceae bacterium]|nr:hypothetical protein [Muribaculaceae bacterium]
MTAKFKQIIEQLNALITFTADKSMSDEDFIANIDAINLLCNLYEGLGLDCSAISRRMSNLYPELNRRIYGKENIQHAMLLIKALSNFIYGRADNFGPERWREALAEMCCRLIEAYRQEPQIDSTDYLFALDIVSRLNVEADNLNIKEYKEIVVSYLEDIDVVSIAEKIKRIRAYESAKHLFVSDNGEKWTEAREMLKLEDVSQLDDQTFILWREITGIAPMKELKKRAVHSKQMQVEYLKGLIFNEFKRVHRVSVKRKLARELKTLNDDLINDIIPLKIDADMSVSTLHAIETIFDLRLQLAQVGWDENVPTYNCLCNNRFEQLAKALKKKYKTTAALNEKIEILERLVTIGMNIDSDDFSYALDEADNLKELPGLTYAQQLRLSWIPDIDSENASQIVAKLLPQTNTPFEIGTLALISDFITAEERKAVLNRYFDLFDAALSSGNIAELGKLLTLAAYWNSDPTVRPRLTEAASKAQAVDGLSLPERRINLLAAEIYQRIDANISKCEDIA